MELFGPPNVEKLKARRDVGGLIRALDGMKDPCIRRSAAVALGEIRDERALWPLQDALWDPEVCREAALALGKLGDPRAIPGLGTALQRERGYVTKCELIKIMGKFDRPDVIEFIVPALDDPNLEVRITAGRVLARLGWRPEEQVTKRVFTVARIHDAFRAGRYDEIGEWCRFLPREELLASLGGRDAKARRYAAHVMGEIADREAFNVLITYLEQETVDIHFTIEVVDGLAKSADPFAIQPMLDAYYRFRALGFSDDLARLRNRLTSALVCIGEPGLGVLQSNLDCDAVIDALGRMGGEGAIDLLIEALRLISDLHIVAEAARYLGEAKSGKAVAPLCGALKRVSDASCLDCIARALRMIGDPRAIPSLVDVLPEIVAQGKYSPEMGGHPEVVHALIDMGEPARGPLRRLLEEETLINVREEVEFVLGKISAD
jgi:HEAT repeat protein